MILINQGAENIVAVTLYEKTTIDADLVHYLFQFKSPVTDELVYCIPADTSSFISRYNKFTITEKASPDPLAGEVELQPTGKWFYYVYEQESATNLDPAGLTLVESGFCRVMKADVDPDEYNSQPTEYTIYNKANI